MSESTVTWRSGMSFDAEVEGLTVPLDASETHGGQGYGPRPKTLVLTALAGCTAMDVVAILRKMRISLAGLDVSAEGTVRDEHPRVFTDVVLTYRFRGDALPVAKLQRAVQLSEARYCPVNAMLGATVHITSEIEVNGSKLEMEPA